MSFNIHSSSPVVVLSPLFKGSGLRGLCGSHQEGVAALWPVASLLRLLQSGHVGSAGVSLPSRTFQDLPEA